jgi:hypothetical protein
MVSDRFQQAMTALMLACLAAGVGGVVLGRLDVAVAGGVSLVLAAWVLGQLGLRSESESESE